MAIRQVLTTNTFEEQRLIINQIGSDVGDIQLLPSTSIPYSGVTGYLNLLLSGSIPFPSLSATNLTVTSATISGINSNTITVKNIVAQGTTGTPGLVLTSTASGVAWIDPISSIVIPSGYINTPMIANGAVTTSKIAASGITNNLIQDGAVSTSKIQTSAITNSLIADGAVTTLKIAASGVTTDRILDRAITSSKIAISGVTTLNLADDSVTAQKINVTSSGIPSFTSPILGKFYYELSDNTLKLNDGTDWSSILTYKTRSTILGWKSLSTSQVVTVNTAYYVDTSSAVVTATLPSSPNPGDYISFVDKTGSWGLYNLVVIATPNSILNSLNISDPILYADVNFASFNLVWTGNVWRLF